MTERLALDPGRKKRSLLGIIVTIITVAAATIGLLILAIVVWFFAACANNPDCLRFG